MLADRLPAVPDLYALLSLKTMPLDVNSMQSASS